MVLARSFHGLGVEFAVDNNLVRVDRRRPQQALEHPTFEGVRVLRRAVLEASKVDGPTQVEAAPRAPVAKFPVKSLLRTRLTSPPRAAMGTRC